MQGPAPLGGARGLGAHGDDQVEAAVTAEVHEGAVEHLPVHAHAVLDELDAVAGQGGGRGAQQRRTQREQRGRHGPRLPTPVE